MLVLSQQTGAPSTHSHLELQDPLMKTRGQSSRRTWRYSSSFLLHRWREESFLNIGHDVGVGVGAPQGNLLSGSMLETLTCGQTGSSQLRQLLLVPEEQQEVLQAYWDIMCGGAGAQRSERFRRMSEELREQLNRQTAAEKVG